MLTFIIKLLQQRTQKILWRETLIPAWKMMHQQMCWATLLATNVHWPFAYWCAMIYHCFFLPISMWTMVDDTGMMVQDTKLGHKSSNDNPREYMNASCHDWHHYWNHHFLASNEERMHSIVFQILLLMRLTFLWKNIHYVIGTLKFKTTCVGNNGDSKF